MKPLFQTMLTGAAVVGLTSTVGTGVILLSKKDEEAPDPLIRFWARNLLRAAGVRTVTEGLEHLPPGNFVLVVNHQSHFDVPVLFAEVERHIRFVAKAQLFRIPLFGAVLRSIGTLAVDRSGGEKDKATLNDAARSLADRLSVVFFPEGTRSEDGEVKAFKKGAAVLAIEAQVPLVPAALSGTRHILPKGSRQIHGGRTAALVLGPPLPTSGLTLEDRDRLTEQARQAVLRLFERANALALA